MDPGMCGFSGLLKHVLGARTLSRCGCGTLVALGGFCGAGPGVMVSCTGRKGNPWAEGLAGLAKSCFWDAET